MDVFPAFALPIIRTRNWIFGFGRRWVFIGATSGSKRIDSIDSSHDRVCPFSFYVHCHSFASLNSVVKCQIGVLCPAATVYHCLHTEYTYQCTNIWAIHNLRILLPMCDIVGRVALSTLTHPALRLEHQDPIQE